MLTKLLKITVLLVFVAAMIAGSVFLHRENAKLRARTAELRHRNEAVVRVTEENQRTREFLAQIKSDATEAGQSFHADVLRMRADVSELEERARAASVQRANAAATIAANRDPEKGMMRLENFQNVGRGTPVMALQTLIWAALKDDQPALLAAFSVTGDAREKAEELLAHLPEADRAKYPTPESLAALVIANEVLRADAVQVVPTVQLGSHAIVTVRVADSDDDAKVPMEFGADGWKVIVPKKLLSGVEKKISPPPVPLPKK